MATRTWLISVSVSIEQPEELADGDMPQHRMLGNVQETVTAALAKLFAGEPETKVQWESMHAGPLDDLPGVGRCAVCNCWVFDAENCTEHVPPVNPGAVVDGRLLCDEHLPEDHPVAF
jgi:hypothetical protein